MPILAIVLVLAALGVGGWAMGWFGGDADSAPADGAAAGAGDAAEAQAATPGSAESDLAEPTPPAPTPPAAAPQAPTPGGAMDAPPTEALLDDLMETPAQPARPRPAPLPLTRAAEPEPEEPLGPLLEFEPLPPLPDTDPEEFARWSEALITVYVDGTSGRKERELRTMLEQGDVVDQTPAYINTLIGRDMSDPIQVRDTFRLVDHWQKRVANFPRFFFDGDTTKMDVEDVNKRVKVVLDPKQGWIAWWRGKQDDAGALSKYREDLAAQLAKTTETEEG